MSFQIGDRVRWQARTGDPEREGTVEKIVPAEVMPCIAVGNITDYNSFMNKYVVCFNVCAWRNEESYIILTDPGKRGGKPSAFRPLVKNLKLVKPENKQQ